MRKPRRIDRDGFRVSRKDWMKGWKKVGDSSGERRRFEVLRFGDSLGCGRSFGGWR